jgi:hypothetical protein
MAVVIINHSEIYPLFLSWEQVSIYIHVVGSVQGGVEKKRRKINSEFYEKQGFTGPTEVKISFS